MTKSEAKNPDPITYDSVGAWELEGIRRFGSDKSLWAFVCPSCGHRATQADWRQAGAGPGAVAFSCVGRYTGNAQEMFTPDGGPCNYAGGGLLNLNPVAIAGVESRFFDFAPAPGAAETADQVGVLLSQFLGRNAMAEVTTGEGGKVAIAEDLKAEACTLFARTVDSLDDRARACLRAYLKADEVVAVRDSHDDLFAVLAFYAWGEDGEKIPLGGGYCPYEQHQIMARLKRVAHWLDPELPPTAKGVEQPPK